LYCYFLFINQGNVDIRMGPFFNLEFAVLGVDAKLVNCSGKWPDGLI
jgi:hypothetical protein